MSFFVSGARMPTVSARWLLAMLFFCHSVVLSEAFLAASTYLIGRRHASSSRHPCSLLVAMSGNSRPNPVQVLHFLNICGKLKRTVRTGWKRCGIEDSESVADHSWRMGILAILLPDGLDREHCIKMAIVHDIAESLVGDITPHDGISKQEKSRRETEAIAAIRMACGDSDVGNEIQELWLEYEQAATPEAKAVKDLDKFEMILQAEEYEKSHGIDLEQFFESTKSKIRHPEVQAWEQQLRTQRQKRLLNQDTDE